MTSSSPLFYVLHDVNANTYSRTLIPNDNIQNLHTLFEVRPRWFNRTKTACDRIGVTMISFKDATPHTEMVSLRHANKRVRRAVKCIDDDFLKSLSGGGKRKKKSVFPSYNTISTMAKGVLVGVAVQKYGKTAYNAYAYLTKDDKVLYEKNKTCLKNLMTAFGGKNVLPLYNNNIIPDIRLACKPQLQPRMKFTKTMIGKRIFIFDEKHVIKEQIGSCSTFINEITCLYTLIKLDITPKIIESYVCIKTSVEGATDDKKVTYGFLVTKLNPGDDNIAMVDRTLFDYIKQETIPEEKQNTIVSLLNNIFVKLKLYTIHHTNLRLDNFIVDKNCEKIWVDSFAGAERNNAKSYNNNLLLFIEQNEDTDEKSKVSILMTAFKDSLTVDREVNTTINLT